MLNGLIHAHSGLRWVFLVLILGSLLLALTNKKVFGDKEKKFALFTMILAHLQFTIGIVLYFMSNKVRFSAETMSTSVLRFFTMEHILGMLIAIVLITIGRKKALLAETPEIANKKIVVFFGIGLIIILAMIPWPFRVNLGGAWF